MSLVKKEKRKMNLREKVRERKKRERKEKACREKRKKKKKLLGGLQAGGVGPKPSLVHPPTNPLKPSPIQFFIYLLLLLSISIYISVSSPFFFSLPKVINLNKILFFLLSSNYFLLLL